MLIRADGVGAGREKREGSNSEKGEAAEGFAAGRNRPAPTSRAPPSFLALCARRTPSLMR